MIVHKLDSLEHSFARSSEPVIVPHYFFFHRVFELVDNRQLNDVCVYAILSVLACVLAFDSRRDLYFIVAILSKLLIISPTPRYDEDDHAVAETKTWNNSVGHL
jgi:hypothetical protein